jgi:hypothetical protein
LESEDPMRRLPLWLVAALLAAGCGQPIEPSSPGNGESPVFAKDPAERTIVFRFDESATFFDECFGEDVLFEAHRQIVTFFRGPVTNAHFHFRLTALGSTATGQSSGTVWTLHGTIVQGLNGDITSPETPGEFTFLVNQVLTSPGTGAKLQIRERLHITINSNETVTVNRDSFEVVCS